MTGSARRLPLAKPAFTDALARVADAGFRHAYGAGDLDVAPTTALQFHDLPVALLGRYGVETPFSVHGAAFSAVFPQDGKQQIAFRCIRRHPPECVASQRF